MDKLKDANILSCFRSEIEQRAQDVCSVPTTATDQLWAGIKAAYHDVGSECLGPPPRGLRPWMSIQTWEKIQERGEIKLSLNDALPQHRRVELTDLYREKQKEVKRSVKNDKRSYTEALAQAAEDAAVRGDSRNLYKITKELTGKALATEHPLKDANGQLVHGEDDQIARWRNHFCSVLNHVLDGDASLLTSDLPQMPSMRINDNSPTLREIKDTIASLPNNKAA